MERERENEELETDDYDARGSQQGSEICTKKIVGIKMLKVQERREISGIKAPASRNLYPHL